MEIKSKLPVNITDEYAYLFLKKERYTLKPLKIRILKNVFVTHWGLLIKNGILPKRSAENLLGFYDQPFYFVHWKTAIEQFLVSKFGNSLKSIRLNDDESYFTIHTPWFGYFSWHTTYLPRLLSIKEKYPDATLLIPEEWNRIAFVKESLEMFSDLKLKIIPHDHHAFIKNYVFSETRPWTSIFYPEQVQQVRNVYFKHLDQVAISIKPIHKIYASRKKASRRNISNEEEIEACLIQNGFEIICFEDYTVFEQIFLMKHADVVVSMHGAGLTNALFMKEKSVLLELTPKVQHAKQFRFPFWRIASILNLSYYVQFCETVDNGESEFYSRNIHVELAEFTTIIQSINQTQVISEGEF